GIHVKQGQHLDVPILENAVASQRGTQVARADHGGRDRTVQAEYAADLALEHVDPVAHAPGAQRPETGEILTDLLRRVTGAAGQLGRRDLSLPPGKLGQYPEVHRQAAYGRLRNPGVARVTETHPTPPRSPGNLRSGDWRRSRRSAAAALLPRPAGVVPACAWLPRCSPSPLGTTPRGRPMPAPAPPPSRRRARRRTAARSGLGVRIRAARCAGHKAPAG